MMQIGTLSGNPIAAAAGLKTLEILKRPGAYERIFKTGRALMEGYAEILEARARQGAVVGDAPMFDIVFTDREVKDYRSALGDEATMKRCNALLRERGILKGESKYYISLAHTDEDVPSRSTRLPGRLASCRGDGRRRRRMRVVGDAWVWLRQRWEVRATDAKVGSGGECMAFHLPFRIALAVIVTTAAWVGPWRHEHSIELGYDLIQPGRTQFAGAGLSVDVQVDGKPVGSIGNGGCVNGLRLPAGRHTVSGGSMSSGIFTGGGRRGLASS